MRPVEQGGRRMLIKKKKNKGFTLVEVIVSMLVLSITIVSVLSAFVYASKSNVVTKRMQAAESLLEDLVEYTNAYAKEFDPDQGIDALNLYDMFGGSCTVVTPFSSTNDVEVSEFTGIKKGSGSFKVRVTRDRNPAKYATGAANTEGIITFGETGSKTILINAATGTYDDTMVDYFWELHKSQVGEYNLSEYEKEGTVPGYVASPETALDRSEIDDKITREIWVEMESASADKVRVTAYSVYKIEDGVLFPDDAARQEKKELFTSEEFDLSTSTNPAAKKLKQIYILYRPSTEAQGMATTDIRILDRTSGMTSGQLDANIFIAYQTDSAVAVDTAITLDSMDAYYGGEKEVRVSFAEGGVLYHPTRADVYCSSKLNITDSMPATVSKHEKSLVAANAGIRVVAVEIEVLDPDTDQVLTQTKDAVVCLQ